MAKLAYGIPVAIDARRALNLTYGSSSSNTNGAKIATAAEDSSATEAIYQKLFYFEGGRIDLTDAPIVLPSISGLGFCGGGGLAKLTNEGATTIGPTTRLNFRTSGLNFDGSTFRATTSGASATITVIGTAVVSGHANFTLEITGGTNFITGFYHVVSVSPGASGVGTWTLDRTCTTGNGSALIGRATATYIKDPGFGTTWSQMEFRGNVTPFPIGGGTAIRCHIGYHIVPIALPINTGKQSFVGCNFSDFTSAILCGTDMRQAFETSSTTTGIFDDLHADNIYVNRCQAQSCRTFLHLRTGQAVGHTIDDLQAQSVKHVIYSERGGQVYARHIKAAGTDCTLLRIGLGQIGAGQYTLEHCSFDSESEDPCIVSMDDIGNGGQSVINVNNCLIDPGITSFDNYLYDIVGNAQLNIVGGTRLQPDSIRLRSRTDGFTYLPHVTVIGSMLEGLASASTPEEIVDAAPTGSSIEFIGCRSPNGAKIPNKSVTF